MGRATYSFVLTSVLVLSICINLINCLYETEIYRMLAYEDNNVFYGSKSASLNLNVAHFADQLLRKLALIRLTALTEDNLLTILNKKASGVLILVPNQQKVKEDFDLWANCSRLLARRTFHIPVYVTWETPDLREIYEGFEARQAAGQSSEESGYQFIVNSEEPKLMNPLGLEDFYGFLENSTSAAQTKRTSSNLPYIMVVASYDQLSLFPDFDNGVPENARGASALFKLMRQFSRLYKSYPYIKYNLLFYLSSSKNFGYESLAEWLNKPENSRITNNLFYILVLDSIGTADAIHLQVVESVAASAFEVLKVWNNTANNFNLSFKVVLTNESPFHSKIPTILFTDNPFFVEAGQREKIQVEAKKFNATVYRNHVNFIGEVLLNTIYNSSKNFKVGSEEFVDDVFAPSVDSFLYGQSLFVSNIGKGSAANKEIEKLFAAYSHSPSRISHSIKSPRLYSYKKAKLQITKPVSPFLDLYIFGGTCLWLFVLYTVFSGKSDRFGDKKRR